MKYVYVLKAGENHYKVGVATSVKKRLAGLQTSNPVKVEIVSAKLLEDAYAVEGRVHEQLKSWNVSGEWFKLEPHQVIDLLIELNRLPEPDLAMAVRLRDILANQAEAQKRIENKLSRVVDEANKNVAARREIMERNREKTELPPIAPRVYGLTDSELRTKALLVIQRENKASTSLLQRRLRIGYGRAARLLEDFEREGIVGKQDGSRPRVLLKQPHELVRVKS